MRSDDQHLLDLLRPLVGSQAPPAALALSDTIISAAAFHRVVPLLHHVSTGYPALTRMSLGQAARDTFLRAELRMIMETASSNGISLVPYKGPCLSEQLYAPRGLRRQYDDLDFLVSHSQREEARSMLLEQGYTDTCTLPHHLRRRHARTWGSCFLSPSKEYFLDLHSSVAPSFYHAGIDFDELALTQVELESDSYTTISRVDMLILSCLHGAKHYWERWSWLMDTAFLISSLTEEESYQCLQRASSRGLRRVLLLGAAMCRQWLGCELPLKWDLALKGEEWQSLADFCVARLASRQDDRMPRQLRAEIGFVVRSRERFSDRAVCFLRWMTEPSHADLSRVALPDSLYFMYYLQRPIRLTSQWLVRRHPLQA